MAFTMHSHSGQFCPGHAKDNLQDIIDHAIALGFKTIGLTEHMPRYEERDLYPEERSQPAPLAALQSHYEGYLTEAQRLQSAYADRIAIIIGFEGEFIRPSFAQHVLSLRDASPRVIDYVIGSVHHVHGLPIDYDAAMYADAARQAISLRSSSIDTTSAQAQEWLQCDYYDLQHDMLRALEPRVVGHFDLIRLLAADPAADPRASPAVWERVMRNLNLVKAQGGWLECNTAALRKGLAEPYPCRAIAEAWISMGGKFTMSDDSHGIAHVATNYPRGLSYLESLGVTDLWTFRRVPSPDGGPATLQDVAVPITEFRKSFP